MAKKRKTSQPEATDETPEDVVSDVTEQAAEETAKEPEIPEPMSEEPAPEPEPPVVEEEAPEVAEDPVAPEPEPVQETPEPTPARHEHVDSAHNSVLLPAILGGLIAAGIGFGVAYYMIPRANPELNDMVAANTSALGDLQGELATVAAAEPQIDLAPVTASIETLRTEISTEIDGLSERIGTFDERLTTLEKQPSGDGTLQEAALEAYQRELDALRSQVEEQASAAFDQLESTRAEAAAIEQAARSAARAAQIRAALAQIQTSMADGTPMGAALEDLQDAMDDEIPTALTEVAAGAPTLAKLQADFPNAARAALATARSGGQSGEENTAFGAFLREQLNVRSVAPRDGDDADAILSRAQAAVSEGQLQIALDEIATLPDVAKAPLAEWTAVAETRVAAQAALDDISLSLNDS